MITKGVENIDLLLVQCDLFNAMVADDACMGYLYIATYLESQGYSVKILSNREIFYMTDEQLKEYLQEINPKVTGFHIASDNFKIVLERARKIRKWIPDTWIITGGPLAPSIREEILEYPFFDAVVTGEGEYATEKICSVLCRKKGKLSQVEGIIFKKDKNLCFGPPSSTIADLDAIPAPDKKYFGNSQFFRIVSGRGCPYECTFCFQSVHGLKYRFRSSKNVLNEVIEKLESHPFNAFSFVDDVFIMNPKRCLEIAKGLQEYRQKTNRDFIFFCQGRVNVLEKYPEMINELSKAGMCRMQLGVESGDMDVLEAYKKQITPDQVRKTVSYIRDTQTSVAIGGFILGGPFESHKTFNNTLNLALELIEMAPGAFVPSAGFLGAYPGTEIAKNPSKFGIKQVEEDFIKGISLTDVQFVTETFKTKDEIRQLKRIFDLETKKAMIRNIPRIPQHLLYLHYLWGQRNLIYSQWYSNYLSHLEAPMEYFKFFNSPCYQTLKNISIQNIAYFYPTRVVESRKYDEKGNIILPSSVINLKLEKPKEILIYELSSGKLNFLEIARRLKEEMNLENSIENIIKNIMLPFYFKLEKTYHVIFRR